MRIRQDKDKKLVRRKLIRLGLLIPLLFSFIWLIVLLPSYKPGESFAPSMLPSLIRGISIFIIIYGIALIIFYSRMK